MIQVFVQCSAHSSEVLQVTTIRPRVMISDLNTSWYDFIFDETSEIDFINRGIKWAIPGSSTFDGFKFSLNTIYTDYTNLVRDEFNLLRLNRNSLLSSSDWTQIRDAGLSEERIVAWQQYRQLLRDLPNNTVNPYVPNWPKEPI